MSAEPATDADGSRDSPTAWGFESFLSEQYELFALLGIFGSISVYLSQSTPTAPGGCDLLIAGAPRCALVVEIGTVASVLAFIVVAAYLNRALYRCFDGALDLLFTLTAARGLGITLFVLPFDLLVIAVILGSFGAGPAVAFFARLVAFVLGAVGYNESGQWLLVRLARADPARPVGFGARLLVTSVLTLVVAYWSLRTLGVLGAPELLHPLAPWSLRSVLAWAALGVAISAGTLAVASTGLLLKGELS